MVDDAFSHGNLNCRQKGRERGTDLSEALRFLLKILRFCVVGDAGFEPATSAV